MGANSELLSIMHENFTVIMFTEYRRVKGGIDPLKALKLLGPFTVSTCTRHVYILHNPTEKKLEPIITSLTPTCNLQRQTGQEAYKLLLIWASGGLSQKREF